ncbi:MULTISPECIES: hypothetical protein [Peribacillus]|uniref:hypothetical protein n=1 Tax=Peribacillus TaxID=2675229 RepID=UPI001F4DF5E3|nr:MULTISPECIES: hypothetical protein [unclassified Peribacillus]MCK1986182.1 hypothetical protein [Peribacillus sp. Aquil_B1]MCK2010942.1 hypothetical protein [Peribacillus sp. Aquil_B8]
MNQRNAVNAGRSTNQERQIANIVLWIAAARAGKTVKDLVKFPAFISALRIASIYGQKKEPVLSQTGSKY